MLDLQKQTKIKYSAISTLGSILVLVASTFPFINNILAIPFPQINTIEVAAANNNLAAVVWSLAICFQATVLVIASHMKPYLMSYAPVLFSSLYSSAFYFLPLLGYAPNEDAWFFIAIISIILVILAVMYFTKLYLHLMKVRERLLIRSLEEIVND